MMSENEKIRMAFDSHYESKVKGIFVGGTEKVLDEAKENQSVSIRIKDMGWRK